MRDFWADDPPTDLVITFFDLVENRTCFAKPWKPEYAGWPVVQAVLERMYNDELWKQPRDLVALLQKQISREYTLELGKRHVIKPVSTRRYYPGEHAIEILINGKPVGRETFTLRVR